uniref:Uncharacterized protein n=1 Tax=viral metagenome TaxID=1070528 RepID=A0A6C0EAT4_9ZZZZ
MNPDDGFEVVKRKPRHQKSESTHSYPMSQSRNEYRRNNSIVKSDAFRALTTEDLRKRKPRAPPSEAKLLQDEIKKIVRIQFCRIFHNYADTIYIVKDKTELEEYIADVRRNLSELFNKDFYRYEILPRIEEGHRQNVLSQVKESTIRIDSSIYTIYCATIVVQLACYWAHEFFDLPEVIEAMTKCTFDTVNTYRPLFAALWPVHLDRRKHENEYGFTWARFENDLIQTINKLLAYGWSVFDKNKDKENVIESMEKAIKDGELIISQTTKMELYREMTTPTNPDNIEKACKTIIAKMTERTVETLLDTIIWLLSLDTVVFARCILEEVLVNGSNIPNKGVNEMIHQKGNILHNIMCQTFKPNESMKQFFARRETNPRTLIENLYDAMCDFIATIKEDHQYITMNRKKYNKETHCTDGIACFYAEIRSFPYICAYLDECISNNKLRSFALCIAHAIKRGLSKDKFKGVIERHYKVIMLPKNMQSRILLEIIFELQVGETLETFISSNIANEDPSSESTTVMPKTLSKAPSKAPPSALSKAPPSALSKAPPSALPKTAVTKSSVIETKKPVEERKVESDDESDEDEFTKYIDDLISVEGIPVASFLKFVKGDNDKMADCLDGLEQFIGKSVNKRDAFMSIFLKIANAVHDSERFRVTKTLRDISIKMGLQSCLDEAIKKVSDVSDDTFYNVDLSNKGISFIRSISHP